MAEKILMSMKYDPILYDADKRAFLEDEINFYITIINRLSPKTILELGVGTGRIISKLAPIVEGAMGIDNSVNMLNVAESRLATQGNVKLLERDFTDFNLNQKFDLVYFPFNSFQHILDDTLQLSCLKSVVVHMHKESKFILDLMRPNNLVLDMAWREDYKSETKDGWPLERFQRTIDVDNRQGVIHKQFMYVVKDAHATSKHIFDAYMKITSDEAISKLFTKSGLLIEEILPDYGTGLHNKRIFVLRKDI